jgi:hypothetical protein
MYIYIHIYQSIHKTKSWSPSPYLTLPGFNTTTLKAQEDEGASIGADSLKTCQSFMATKLINANGKRQKRKKKGHGPEVDGIKFQIFKP